MPLTPFHVSKLVATGVKVVIQPSALRIFTNEQYEKAGATITENLELADVILGVKQVSCSNLLSKKTYMFFSHTIKGQTENMALLDAIRSKNITLFDYECITENGKLNGKRLIAFGENAGQAGMIAGLRGLGERLIHLGYSTPFVNIGSAYMYCSLESAKKAVETAGNKIKVEGIPRELAPLSFVFTGEGNVSRGAQEIFRLMPHQMVNPSELPHLPPNPHILYGTVATSEFLAVPKDPNARASHSKRDYYAHPDQYEGVFHDRIAPYTSMIINGMYWDDRFPRLMTKHQLKQMYDGGNRKLIGIADITCDIGGGIEWTEYATKIEKPFAMYDITNGRMRDGLDGDGVMMMTVDHLPSELAIESSQHFGEKLMPFLQTLTSVPLPLQVADLPTSLKGACIVSNGALAPAYEYIDRLRADKSRRSSGQLPLEADQSTSCCIRLEGHLFDTGLINKILDLVESEHGESHLFDCKIRPSNYDAAQSSISSAILRVTTENKTQLESIKHKISNLCSSIEEANASMTELNECSVSQLQTQKQTLCTLPAKQKRSVLCLGSGLVAAPLVEYLSREDHQHVTIVSGVLGEAERTKNRFSRPNIHAIHLDVLAKEAELQRLINDADCVVSLLPASMHVQIANLCISSRVPMVTASYVSPDMKMLDSKAREAKIPILCELGLDPGMDHMSAVKVIDEVKALGGTVVSFSSVCGGLPSPEAADNPIGYKFSWSPRGVLTAALNSARYRKNGEIVNVEGKHLLRMSEPIRFLPALALEQIPNRDSLIYGDLYGIPHAETLFRGTLRYNGCCRVLDQLKHFGLFDTDNTFQSLPFSTWPELLHHLETTNRIELDDDAAAFINWLGMCDEKTQFERGSSTLDTFCSLLQKKLSYEPGERDMALMHHEFGIQYRNGRKEKRTSTFVGYGSENGDTIMAKTVGITAAIGAQLILDKVVLSRGVLIPTTREIYEPALDRLKAEGIGFKERIVAQP